MAFRQLFSLRVELCNEHAKKTDADLTRGGLVPCKPEARKTGDRRDVHEFSVAEKLGNIPSVPRLDLSTNLPSINQRAISSPSRL